MPRDTPKTVHKFTEEIPLKTYQTLAVTCLLAVAACLAPSDAPAQTPSAQLAKRALCTGTGLFVGGAVTVNVTYVRSEFTDGSVFTTCRVNASNGGSIPRDGLPLFLFPGEDTSCKLSHDVDTLDGSGDGAFRFWMIPGDPFHRAQGQYLDPESPSNEIIFWLDCVERTQ